MRLTWKQLDICQDVFISLFLFTFLPIAGTLLYVGLVLATSPLPLMSTNFSIAFSVAVGTSALVSLIVLAIAGYFSYRWGMKAVEFGYIPPVLMAVWIMIDYQSRMEETANRIQQS